MAVTIGKSTLEDKIKEIEALDDKITQVKGDEKVLRAQAESTLLAMPAGETSTPIMDVEDVGDPTFDLGFGTFGDVYEAVQSVESWLDQARAWMDQQVNEYVKAQRAGSADDVKAMVEARTVLATHAEALRTILEGSGVEDLPAIPKARKASGGTSSSTRTVKVSGAQYYRVIDGEHTDQPDSQNTLSSLVYYQSHHFSEDGKRMPTDAFVQWAKSEGVDVKQATDWAIESPSGKVTVGMRVVSAE
jgi:hypothetical protein